LRTFPLMRTRGRGRSSSPGPHGTSRSPRTSSSTTSSQVGAPASSSAGINGGGLFCDDSATCLSEHDIYDGNCGGNVYVDAGPEGTDPTIGKFDHMTNVNAKEVGCDRPGAGFALDNGNEAADDYTITNSIFFGNKDASDLVASCGDGGCDTVEVNISYSMVQKEYANLGVDVTFGAGILSPADPLFVDAAKGDFHLQSNERPLDSDGLRRRRRLEPGPRQGQRQRRQAFGKGRQQTRARRLRQQRRIVLHAIAPRLTNHPIAVAKNVVRTMSPGNRRRGSNDEGREAGGSGVGHRMRRE
jgi:hypothetical protein